MKITDIQINQVSQNVEKSNPAVDKTAGSPVSRVNSCDLSVKTEMIRTQQGQAQVINPAVNNNIREQLDEILVHYPPFFPIAKYQRLDLIEKVKGIEEKMENLSIDENLKQMLSGKKLTEDATDNELSCALDKLFYLRGILPRDGAVSSDAPAIGSILNIKA